MPARKKFFRGLFGLSAIVPYLFKNANQFPLQASFFSAIIVTGASPGSTCQACE
jgi:hypothetical protein